MKSILPLISEYLGTFLLTLAVISTSNPLVLGLVFAGIGFLIGGISGANINPAISFAFYMQGRLDGHELFMYIAVQCVAAITAFSVFKVVS
jgi:glycerol uptake facilitator-like aquaporin